MKLINIKREITLRLKVMGSNQTCLCASIGMRQPSLSKKMTKNNFTLKELVNICNFLGCTPNDLLINEIKL